MIVLQSPPAAPQLSEALQCQPETPHVFLQSETATSQSLLEPVSCGDTGGWFPLKPQRMTERIRLPKGLKEASGSL